MTNINTSNNEHLHNNCPIDYFDLTNLEWDETLSPLRLCFHTDDPKRRGREFSSPPTSNQQMAPQILEHSVTPQPSGVCYSLQTTWLEALTLIVRGEEHGIYARFDEDGQLMISGYSLHDAGLISADCTVTCTLLPGEMERYQLGNPPANAQAIDPVLLMYVDTLKDATELVLRRNLVCAIGWLMASGKVKVIDLALPSGDVQQKMVN